MCVIVDASLAPEFFAVDRERRPLWKWINDGKAVLVVGGKLTEELVQIRRAAEQIQTWRRAGLVHLEPNEKVDAEASEIQGRCKSNDSHVIALARVSGARLLCACDGYLEADFKSELISNPRGAIYKRARHARHLLRHEGRCPHKPGGRRG